MSIISPPRPAPPESRQWRVAGVVVTILTLLTGLFFAYRFIGGSSPGPGGNTEPEIRTGHLHAVGQH